MTTSSASRSVLTQTATALVLCFVLIWTAVYFELERSYTSYLRLAEQSNVFQAQAFAENTQSTIKRVNEILLDMRVYWAGDPKQFAELVQRRQEYVSDIAFQVAIIDAEGYLSYSNLAAPSERTFLGEREHFRVHRDAAGTPGADRLFISKPLKGKVSGKWSIQFTRPILNKDHFVGVMVISVSPDAFASYYQKLNLGVSGSALMTMTNGEVMARFPDPGNALGQKIVGSPFVGGDAPLAGTYARISQVDGISRNYGFYRLPEYGFSFVVSQATEEVLAPYYLQRKAVIGMALVVSTMVLVLLAMIYRSLFLRTQVERQLRESQAMLRSAVETIGEAFVVYDQDDRLAFCNEQYREIYRASADLLVPGRSFEEIIRTGAERGQYRDAVGRVDDWVAERMAKHRRGDSDLIQQLDDGKWLRIRERKTPEGFIVGFRIDVTEFYRAKEAAEAANRAKSQFLATMSHEIRTPMNGILGMAQLLMMPELKEDERHQFARTILNSGQTLLGLLNDILDLSKVEAGKLKLERADFDPRQIIDETSSLYAETARSKGVMLDVAWDGEEPGCYSSDRSRIRQMLNNLVSNAIKFTDHGSVRITGRVLEQVPDSAVLEYSVIDSGIGIPADKRMLLFQPFSQIDSSSTRKYGGTGLGLSIVSTLAQLLGGEVGVESGVGEGSRFWFRVRVERAMPQAEVPGNATAPVHESVNIVVGGDGQRRVPRVLLVEDNLTNQQVVQALLRKRGVTVELAENGQQAVDAVTRGISPDLVLMDCQMPVMDGFTATMQIRQWEQANNRPRLPIVAVTAGAFAEDRMRCMESGMDDFLAKPLGFEELNAALAKWLDGTERDAA